MDKGDIQFAISLFLDLLGFFGIEWNRIRGWFTKPQIDGAMRISKRQRFFEVLVVAGLLMSTWGWYHKGSNTSPEDWMKDRKSLEHVYNRNFGPDDVIELDGKNLHDCHIAGSTIIYRGTQPFYWNHNNMSGDIKIKLLDGPAFTGLSLHKIMLESYPCVPSGNTGGTCSFDVIDESGKSLGPHP